MFETAKIGRTLSKEAYKAEEEELRTELLEAQIAIRERNIPVYVIIAGMEGALASVVAGLVDKPVVAYLDDFPYGDRITIHHLLSHRAGLIDYPAVPENFDIRERLRHSRDEMLAYFADLEPLHPPGSRFHYSNFGYVLLAYILEEVTGRVFTEDLLDRVFSRFCIGK